MWEENLLRQGQRKHSNHCKLNITLLSEALTDRGGSYHVVQGQKEGD